MYLIRGISNHIEDLENGRTYYYDDGLPDYETGEAVAKVVVTGWLDAANGNTYATELAFKDSAKPLWQHLESLLKFDADKAPQPAPVEPPFQHKFKVGDNVIVKPGSALIEHDNRKGTVISTAPYPDPHPYLVRFGAGDTDLFGDSQLEPVPTEAGRKFKTGDRVRIISPEGDNWNCIGTIGFISDVQDSPYAVIFEFAESGEFWFVLDQYEESQLELFRSANPAD